MELKDLYYEIYPQHIQEQKTGSYTIPEMKFIHGDLTQYDWSNADLVLANSTCFDRELMQKILEKAEKMKPGSFIVTFTKSLPYNETFELVSSEKKVMSWAKATVNVYRKSS